jgi:hypothetical protein
MQRMPGLGGAFLLLLALCRPRLGVESFVGNHHQRQQWLLSGDHLSSGGSHRRRRTAAGGNSVGGRTVAFVITKEKETTAATELSKNSVGRRIESIRRNGQSHDADKKKSPSDATNVAHAVVATEGEDEQSSTVGSNGTLAGLQAESLAALEDLANVIDEISKQVSDGTAMLLENLTEAIDDKLVRLPENSAAEFTTFLADFTNEIQRAQQMELQRQLAEIDKRFVRPLENIAFSDVPLLEPKPFKKKAPKPAAGASDDDVVQPSEFIVLGANSTLQQTKGMRTKDILRNFNVAPFYYSIALLSRWVRKASYPSVYAIAIYRSLAGIVKSNTKPRRKDRVMGGESMQAGWKRTGEIASKGSLAKKWAIMRRSAEIWSYFSSFYLKDRRITAKYNSGQWSEEKFKKERSKLGAEVTQNLLKLGPVRAPWFASSGMVIVRCILTIFFNALTP